jgi:hypothetical protein
LLFVAGLLANEVMIGFAGNYPNNTVGSLRCSGDCAGFVAQDIDIGLYEVIPTPERLIHRALRTNPDLIDLL